MEPSGSDANARNLAERDDQYFRILADAVAKCAQYQPKFGQGMKSGVSFEEFQGIYGADPFYRWLGLDSPLMYAAHRAAGGMTSIYRQIGIGGERLFRQILQHSLELTPEQTEWEYEVPLPDGRSKKLSLDGRIHLDQIRNQGAALRVRRWFEAASSTLLVEPALAATLSGAVFEVRQGYKSMDSKRQNADISNAANAYLHRYMPVLFVLSTQIDSILVDRYTRERWLILTGTLDGSETASAYVFCRDVVGYDLAAFLTRNSARLRAIVEQVLSTLLQA